MRTKKIYSKRISKELQRMGNFCFNTMPHESKEGFVIYLFDDTEKLRRDLDKLI